MSSSRSQAGRVLVVMPNWLGDLVMATPLLDVLHQACDNAGEPLCIYACVRRRWAPLLARDPRLTAVLPYERMGRHLGLKGIGRLAASWRKADVDSVILCPPSLRVGLVSALAGIRQRIGYAAGGRRLLLTRALKTVKPRGTMHHTEELLALGAAFLEECGWARGTVSPAMPSLPGLDHILPTNPGEGPPVWILAPGATYGPAKTWPINRVAEFLELAVSGEKVRVAIVGDTATTEFVRQLQHSTEHLDWRHDLPGEAGVIDMVGGTTLVDLAGLLRGAAAFLGNDSGVMHLSAALGVPTLGLFGSSSQAWTEPRGVRAQALVATGFDCQPCFRKTCNQPTFCLDTLGGEAVMTALKELQQAGDEVSS